MNIKGYFKSKFSKERVSKFFDKEGFYIVLFLCVCIVAITAVWVSRTGVNSNENQDLTDVNDNKPAVVTPSAPSQETAVKSTNAQSGITGSEDAKASKEEVTSTKQAEAKTPAKTPVVSSSVNFSSPLKDGVAESSILKDYSPEDLVCFDNLGEWRTHSGIDIKASEGTEVLAVYGGKVINVIGDDVNGLGVTVVIDHNNGYRSVYANLDDAVDVKKNQSIKQGQKIGVVGRTSIRESYISEDSDTESHLHFEVMKKDASSYVNVDPKEYLIKQK